MIMYLKTCEALGMLLFLTKNKKKYFLCSNKSKWIYVYIPAKWILYLNHPIEFWFVCTAFPLIGYPDIYFVKVDWCLWSVQWIPTN